MAGTTDKETGNTPEQHAAPDSDRLSDVKIPEECVEKVPAGPLGTYVPPEEIQGRFDLLRDLSPEQMAALNKKVVSKIDWHMMPCVTVMFLMK